MNVEIKEIKIKLGKRILKLSYEDVKELKEILKNFTVNEETISIQK